jgi:hypothetical protein
MKEEEEAARKKAELEKREWESFECERLLKWRGWIRRGEWRGDGRGRERW